jgi:hypothetical protein
VEACLSGIGLNYQVFKECLFVSVYLQS